MLIFENDYGSSEFFFQEDLENMIKQVTQQMERKKMMEGTGVTNGDIVHSCDALQKPQDQDVPVSPNDNISPVVPLNPPNA